MSVTVEEYQASQAQVKKLRCQLVELNQKTASLQGEVKILNIKILAFEKQIAKKNSENKDFIALLQKQQKQKLSLLSKDRQLSYNQSRGELQARRNQNLIKSLNQQLEKLKAQIDTNVSEKIKWLSQKQEMANKLLIIQQKYKATKNMQEIVNLQKNSLALTTKENDQLKSQIQQLRIKLSSGGNIEKTIISNNKQVIDDLIKDFQEKLNNKQRMMSELRESYEKKIAQLTCNRKYVKQESKIYLI